MEEESRSDRSKRWANMLFAEEEAFQKAANDSAEIGPSRREALARDWFRSLSQVLREFIRQDSMRYAGGGPEPFPGGPLQRAIGLAEELATGRVPLLVRDVGISGGRPSRPPLERRDIATALSFINHAKNGAIIEKAYNLRVSKAFGVDRTTVQAWWRRHQEIMNGIPETPVEQFPVALENAGKRYRFNKEEQKRGAGITLPVHSAGRDEEI